MYAFFWLFICRFIPRNPWRLQTRLLCSERRGTTSFSPMWFYSVLSLLSFLWMCFDFPSFPLKTMSSQQQFSVNPLMPSPLFDWQGEWLLLFNYLIPFSELLDQSGQALDCEGGGARVNIKTEQVRRLRFTDFQRCILNPSVLLRCLSNVFVFLRSVNSLCL